MLSKANQSALQRRERAFEKRVRLGVEKNEGKYLWANGRRLVSFASNDYLGFSHDVRHQEVIEKALKQYGFGGQSSQMVCGHTHAHRALEEALADFTGYPRVLCFANGYMANLGALSTLVKRGDPVFLDRLCHASLIDAVRLSNGALYRYPHSDLKKLALKAAEALSGQPYFVSDAVFSMHGDIAPLVELSQLAKQRGATLLVDDAHGFGVLGDKGRGTLEHFGLSHKEVPLLTLAFGKALGSYGASIATTEEIFDYVLQFSRTYTYTTALPPLVAEVTRFNLNKLKTEPWHRQQLQLVIKRWRENAKALKLPVADSITPIQPLLIGDNKKTLMLGEALKEKGFWVGSIRPPTVPNDEARLRISLTANHSLQEVDDLSETLSALILEHEV